MVREYIVQTCMGKGWSQLPFLTAEQAKEADNIGYTGKDLTGHRTSIGSFLSSLEHGEISVSCTQCDTGDYCEKFLVVRHTKDAPQSPPEGIIIHWDFTTGEELSYIEGLQKGSGFCTHCLDFFSLDTGCNVIVRRKDGKVINLASIQEHSVKEIREAHNIHKMLVAGAFNWK